MIRGVCAGIPHYFAVPTRLALGLLLQPLLTLATGHLARYVTPAVSPPLRIERR